VAAVAPFDGGADGTGLVARVEGGESVIAVPRAPRKNPVSSPADAVADVRGLRRVDDVDDVQFDV
jgi:hypothetical protein